MTTADIHGGQVQERIFMSVSSILIDCELRMIIVDVQGGQVQKVSCQCSLSEGQLPRIN